MMTGISRARRVFLATLIGIGSLSARAGAQQASFTLALVPGSRVRVTARTLVAPLVASYLQQRGDTAVFIEAAGGRGIWSIALSDITKLERSDGERTSNRPLVQRGAIYGAVGGAVVAYSFAALASPSDSSRKYSRTTSALVGAGVGAVVGGILGSRFASERWRPVPLRQVSVVPAPRGLGVSIAF